MADNKTIKCPGCGRPVLNRRADNCLYCGEPLPRNTRFTQEQAGKLFQLEKQRRKNREELNKRPGPVKDAPGFLFDPMAGFDIFDDF